MIFEPPGANTSDFDVTERAPKSSHCRTALSDAVRLCRPDFPAETGRHGGEPQGERSNSHSLGIPSFDGVGGFPEMCKENFSDNFDNY